MLSENLRAVITTGAVIGLIILLILIVRQCSTPDFFYEPFTDEGLPSGWETSLNGSNPADWSWTPDGTANNGKYWVERPAIQSLSKGGAMVFDSDGQDPNAELPTHNASLISPEIRATTKMDRVYLSFYEYYRNYEAKASIEVYGDTDADRRADTWIDITAEVKSGVNNASLGKNLETGAGELLIFDISNYAAQVSGVQLRFTFAGTYYFWLIDDVRLGATNPYPATYPARIGEDLFTAKEPYDIDSMGGAFRPDELVVYFNQFDTTANGAIISITETEKQLVRDELGVDSFVVCPCDSLLELWVFDENGGNNDPPGPNLNSIDILGNKTGAKAKSETLGVDYNYLSISDVVPTEVPANMALVSLPAGIQPSLNQEEVLVAILDTGVDYAEPDLVKHIWQNVDGSCQGPNDFIGFNAVNLNNNPMDNNPDRHGTSVARVVHQNMVATSCNFKLMPVKTHQGNGVGSLFSVSCGAKYAVEEQAKVLNMSWGWYGEPNEVLQIIIQQAQENAATVVAAAGNDGIIIQDTLMYPACYPEPNVLAVAGVVLDSTNTFVASSISNGSPEYIDMAAIGEGIRVLGICDDLAGTSFAAPYVSSRAVIAYDQGSEGKPVWEFIIDCAEKTAVPGLSGFTNGGIVLNPNTNCQ